MLVKAGPGAIPVEKSNNEDRVDSSVSNQRHQRPLGPEEDLGVSAAAGAIQSHRQSV